MELAGFYTGGSPDYDGGAWTGWKDGFHGLHRKFANDLKRKGVPNNTIRTLDGWRDEETMVKTYFKDARMDEMRKGLEALT